MGRQREGEGRGGERRRGRGVDGREKLGSLSIFSGNYMYVLKVQQTALISQLCTSLVVVRYYFVQHLSINCRFGQQGTGT